MIGAWTVSVLMIIGATFMLLGAVGLVRMPDLFTRMQAATKTGTLGISCILLALVVHFADLSVTIRALPIIAFFFLTAPVAAHMIGRAAYVIGVPLWEGAIVDQLRGRYDRHTHVLESKSSMMPPSEVRNEDQRDHGTAGDNHQ